MIVSYKYRAYPDATATTRLNTALDTCRWLYNKLLEECNTARENGSSLTMRGMQAQIVTLKEENPFLKDVYSKVLQMVNYTLWSNIAALSQTKKRGRKIGKLRFKSAARYRTLNYNQSGFKIDREHSTVTFSKIGTIPFTMHRPYSGVVKGVLITRSGDKWYVIIQAEQEVSEPKREGRSVGIDVGLDSFAVDSDGAVIENPRFYEHSRDRIKKLQRSVARKQRFSKNWKKAKGKLEKAYDHVTNQKKDFLHKLSRRYVDTYATICVEDLNIKYLKENGKSRGLRRSIHSASWGRFYSYLSYKAESAGTNFIQVDPRDTTQLCSNCGSIVKKDLSVRVHECPYCGFVADRDYNAAVNIHRVGMEQPFEPVETMPLHHISVMQVLSMKQEAPPERRGVVHIFLLANGYEEVRQKYLDTQMKKIIIRGAREHNLSNINVELPRDRLIVLTGVSGSGKSTLAFDTIYAEGQRRYVESLSAYARQFLGLMQKPDVDSIEGLSPAISIEQKTTSKNPRSTVGTVTEVYDYLRLLFARVGKPFCPVHQIPIEAQSPEKIAARIASIMTGTVTILAPIVRQKKGTYQQVFRDLNREGYARVRVNGEIRRTDEEITLERYRKHDIEVVIDRLSVDERSRLAEAVENALEKSGGLVIAVDNEGHEETCSSLMACPVCGTAFEELQPRMFSFNSPFGACEECNGLGIRMEFDPDLIIPDRNKSIAEGAVALYRNYVDGYRVHHLAAVADRYGFSLLTPIKDLTEQQYQALMYGSNERLRFSVKARNGDSSWSHTGRWEGLVPQAERLHSQTRSDYRRRELEKFMRVLPCPKCGGRRLKDKVLAVKVAGKSIVDVTDLSITEALSFFRTLELTETEREIAKQVLKEIITRLEFLEQVGVGYLTLSRGTGSLSGGEAQRIRLATQIGSNLTGVLYVLDEPSIGLHQRDNRKLLDTLRNLRDLGNTLIVVEHDEETIRSADWVVDMGPGAGLHGGEIVAEGPPEVIAANPGSLTGRYLAGDLKIEVPSRRRRSDRFIRLTGCRANNLKNIDARIPIGVLTVVTGVSGSGKSTLIYDTLYRALMQRLHNSREPAGEFDTLTFDEEIDKVIVIDQSPIGRTPRSNPATYTKVFDEIRKVFAGTKEAKVRGYNAGRFSFNVRGGRCEACQGEGLIKIEMNFLPDVYVECEECRGARYNRETLEVKYRGKSIADVLDMSVEEALILFENVPSIRNKLETLSRVGLGYIKLGQSSTTLSGGEAQRIKLTRELSKRATGKTLYLLDEPTTGLHFHDVKNLIAVLDDLVARGNTMVVIEHNLDVIKSADYIIDLGPEGGDAGGEVIATGTPEEVAEVEGSHTGAFLKKILKP